MNPKILTLNSWEEHCFFGRRMGRDKSSWKTPRTFSWGRGGHAYHSSSSNSPVSPKGRREKGRVTGDLGFQGIDWECFNQERGQEASRKKKSYSTGRYLWTTLRHSFRKTLSFNGKIPERFCGIWAVAHNSYLHLNSQNLWTCSLTWYKGLADIIKLNNL